LFGPNASYPADGGGLMGSSLDGHKSNHSYEAIGRRKNPEGKFMEKKYRKIKSLKFLYEIDEYGNVRNIKSKHIRKPEFDKDGYLVMAFYIDKKTTLRKVHKLVAECWLPPKPGEEYQIDHIDRNKTNNYYKNLRWVTIKQNIANRDEEKVDAHLRVLHDAKRTAIRIVGNNISKDFESVISCAEWLVNQKFCNSSKSASAKRSLIRVISGKRKQCYGFEAFKLPANDL
jgi:hypothetical protein